MRWVGKETVVLLLFLDAFLYVHGASLDGILDKKLNKRHNRLTATNENECDCGNKGSCSLATGDKVCTCDTGYSEKEGKCEVVVDKDICEDRKPCQNGGSCIKKGQTDYECNCTVGYTGKNCENNKWCEDTCGLVPCQYDGETESGLCSCKEGFYFSAKNKACQELDKCLLQRIKGKCTGEHETCIKSKCLCEKNYFYNNNKTVCEPDFCGKKSNKSPCGKNMKCFEGDETFSCICEDGYRQYGKTCVEVNKCAPGESICEQKCKNGSCTCFDGFELQDDEYSCERKESTLSCDLDCYPGSCVKVGTTEKCVCPEVSHVFNGTGCIDKCAAKKITLGECPEKIDCISEGRWGYKCNCTGKYGYADDDIHCKAKKMCSEGNGDEDCAEKGGYCEDDFDTPEGYRCECKFGYEKDANTSKCRDKCEVLNCAEKQAYCIITVENEAVCICPPLLLKDSTGKCGQLAKYSYLGDFLVPKSKYQVVTAEDSRRMKRDTFEGINYSKILKDFEESMKNIFDGYKGTSVLNCTDEYDDWKCYLEIKLDEDPKGKLDIISTPSVCLSLPDESHCLLPPAFETRKRTADDAQVFKKTNPCDRGVTGKLCGTDTECKPSTQGFECKCRKGYSQRNVIMPAPNAVVEICEDIDECLDSAICPNTTKCFNSPGDYTCECIDGYRLEKGKSVKKDGCTAVCDPNPCVHGKCSIEGRNGFTCSCDWLYTGRFCNETNPGIIDLKKDGSRTSAIIGGVLGALLVLAIIISIILFRKLQKQKSIDDTEEYVRQRKRGLVSEMRKLGRRQPESDDVELRDNERRPNRETEDQKYNAQYRMNPIESMSIPRPQLDRSTDKELNGRNDIPDRRESGDYRKGYAGDDRMFPKAHSSRNSGEEYRRSIPRDERQELPRRPLSKSSDHLDNEKIGVSRMQYRNRGYEED